MRRVLVLIWFALLVHASAKRHAPSRPSFKSTVIRLFQARCSATNQFSTCSGNSVHLAHVHSWQQIRDLTTVYIQGKSWMQLIQSVQLLFQVDRSAVVWVRSGGSMQSLSHRSYMSPSLVTLNAQYLRSALKYINDIKKLPSKSNVVDLLTVLNSAPANLRYGQGPINSSIQGKLDPMGNSNQKMTAKEKRWLSIYRDMPKSVRSGTSCSRCSCSKAVWSSSATSDGQNYYVCK